MGRYDKVPEPGLLEMIWGLTWPILMLAFVIGSFCYTQTDEYKQKQETQKILRSEGVIIKKRVNPAGTNLWYDFVLEWSMDQYNLLKRDINGEVDLVRDGIKTLEEGYELAWEEYVDDVMSMFK